MRRAVYTVYVLLLAGLAALCLADAYLAFAAADPAPAVDPPTSILGVVEQLLQVNPYLAALILLVIVILRSQRVRERAFLGHLAAEAQANRQERMETVEVLRGLTSSAAALRADVRTSLHLEARAAAGDPSGSSAGNGQG